MKKQNFFIKKCLSCKSDNLTLHVYEDYDDELNIEVNRNGILCNDCNTFHYEENDKVILAFDNPIVEKKEHNFASYLQN